MDSLYSTIAYALVVFVGLVYFNTRRRGKFPPGPPGLPVIGHLVSFKDNIFETMHKYHEKYGKTIYLKMGFEDVIVSADADLVKKYFVKDVFQSRPEYALMNAFIDPGLLMYNHEEWRVSKRYTMKALKSIGFGGSAFEPFMHQEIQYFLKCIEEGSKKGPIQIAQLAGPAASNIVSLIVLGERFNYDDPTRKMLDEIFLRPLNEKDDIRPLYFSFVSFSKMSRYLVKLGLPGFTFLKKFQERATEHIRRRLAEIRTTYDVNDEPKNYIEMYIKEVHDNRDNPDFELKYFDENHLVRNCYAFFIAGSSTTQEYLEWWFMLMANYPKVQERMRAEIDAVVGQQKATLSMRNSMPYTESVLAEVHRFASLIGLNLQHVAAEDAEFGPYFLPAGTQVILNLNEIHHDPDNFEKPNEFIPERFLSAEGNKFIRSDKLMPFGHGKRSCAGQSLALAEIFLFTVSTLQKFVLKTSQKWNGQAYMNLVSRLPREPVKVIAELRTK